MRGTNRAEANNAFPSDVKTRCAALALLKADVNFRFWPKTALADSPSRAKAVISSRFDSDTRHRRCQELGTLVGTCNLEDLTEGLAYANLHFYERYRTPVLYPRGRSTR